MSLDAATDASMMDQRLCSRPGLVGQLHILDLSNRSWLRWLVSTRWEKVPPELLWFPHTQTIITLRRPKVSSFSQDFQYLFYNVKLPLNGPVNQDQSLLLPPPAGVWKSSNEAA